MNSLRTQALKNLMSELSKNKRVLKQMIFDIDDIRNVIRNLPDDQGDHEANYELRCDIRAICDDLYFLLRHDPDSEEKPVTSLLNSLFQFTIHEGFELKFTWDKEKNIRPFNKQYALSALDKLMDRVSRCLYDFQGTSTYILRRCRELLQSYEEDLIKDDEDFERELAITALKGIEKDSLNLLNWIYKNESQSNRK